MSYQFITATVNDYVAKLTLNRPDKRNAMHGAMVAELLHALRHLIADPQVRVVMLTGNGEHFCAGADINWMQQVTAGTQAENYDDAQYLADLMFALYTFPKPVVTVVQGAAMGGGLGLIAASDIAIAATTANFAFSEVKIGLAPSTISPYVVAAIGERAAHYYFLTGERFNAETAQRMGLVNQVVSPEVLEDTAAKLANTLSQNSPDAMREIKQLLQKVAKEKISEELAQKTAEHLATMRTSPHAKEGLLAFSEKRAPQY